MHNNQSSYSRWSWIVTLVLTLVILWMFLTGQGPCCNKATEAPVAASIAPTEKPNTNTATEAFSFSATTETFTSYGDVSDINWLNDLDALEALLADGHKVEGDSQTVLLSGFTGSDEAKQQKGNDAQAFFGPDIVIDNQIMVMVVNDDVALVLPIAKVYFDTGYHRLPEDGLVILQPIVIWLNDNPDTKAIISGYHDQTGDLLSNQKLAKKRAIATQEALLSAGVETHRIEMRKPVSTEGYGDSSEARRVEISIE